jgi:hypothetical protein
MPYVAPDAPILPLQRRETGPRRAPAPRIVRGYASDRVIDMSGVFGSDADVPPRPAIDRAVLDSIISDVISNRTVIRVSPGSVVEERKSAAEEIKSASEEEKKEEAPIIRP